MSYQKAVFRLTLFSVVLAGASMFGFAQDKAKNQDPMDKPRNVKPELKKAYKDWLEKDVSYVITDEERKAFKKLATDDERERFIEEFWRRRDPDPDTDENEFKEEYYERIAYANEHFASGMPGWKSDRGRIWIMYGKPDERETHPMGGNYERPSYEGGGNTSTYPFEIWFYRYLAGVGSGVEIEFVDPTGSGEYRIARNPNEKDALLNVPGAGLTLSEQLGLSSKGDRISGIGGVGNNAYQREQDSPFSRLQLLADLSRPPQIKFNDLASAVNTGVIEENPLNFDVRVDFFRQSDERVITAITIQVENKDLVFQDSGGLQQARINIFGRITSVAGRRAGVFEDPVITTATTQELSEAKDRKSAYQKAVALAPGTYKVDVIVRDVASGATGVRHIALPVPRYDPQKLSTSTLVLAAKLESLNDQPAVGQFVIGNTKVIPNVSGVYRRGAPVGVYLQVYNAGIDQTTLRPSVDVDYTLLKDGKEVGKQAEDWRGMSDSGQRLTLARLIDTRQLAPGEYELAIRIRDRVSGQALAPSAKFTVQQ
ncbi:MAG TPA: GWxTD domain-containing protein [Pyrinomonadaceae bacterium]|jgi:GWxTD domain-containing protein|nr:GWxTD domain-containing protein [Pyrinomonadaceae bacterium]